MSQLDELKAEINLIMPVLTENLNMAHNEYMAGTLSNGARAYILGRQTICLQVLTDDLPNPNISLENAMKLVRMATIDLRSMAASRSDVEAVLRRWLEFYESKGFTRIHRWFGIPLMEDEPGWDPVGVQS